MPKLKQFFFSDPEDRRNSSQQGIPAPNYSKSKSASICSTAQLPTNLLNANAVKRGSNAQQHFQPVSIEVNQSSPTPPVTNQSATSNLSSRRLSAINISSLNTGTSPTLSNNLNTISGIHVPYPRSPQPTSANKGQHLRGVAVQSSSAINELGLLTSNQQQQPRTPRTRASISNLLMSPKLTSANYDYQLESTQANNNDFEFKNLNYTSTSGLRAPAYNKGRKYSCVAAINPIQTEAFAAHASYLPNQIQKSRRHSRAVADIPSPSQQLRNQERKQSNIQEYDPNLINQQYHNERTTLNRKKYSLANQGMAGGEFSEFSPTSHLVNKPLIQAQQEHQVRKYSNSSTPNSSRKQSRTDMQQYIRDDDQAILQDYNEQQLENEQYNNASKYQNKRLSSSAASHQIQQQNYHHVIDMDQQREQTDYNQFEETHPQYGE